MNICRLRACIKHDSLFQQRFSLRRRSSLVAVCKFFPVCWPSWRIKITKSCRPIEHVQHRTAIISLHSIKVPSIFSCKSRFSRFRHALCLLFCTDSLIDPGSKEEKNYRKKDEENYLGASTLVFQAKRSRKRSYPLHPDWPREYVAVAPASLFLRHQAARMALLARPSLTA